MANTTKRKVTTKKQAQPLATLADVSFQGGLTKEEMAKNLGIEVGAINAQLGNPKWRKKHNIPDPTALYMKKGRPNLYSPEYVQMYEATRKPRKGLSKSAMHLAELKITVPVFDKDAAKFLLKKFGNESGIDKFLREKLMEVYKPVASKLKEIEDRYLREKEEVMAEL